MESRTETQSIETDADPGAIVDLLADPSRIPYWAPAFADAITGDELSGWRATKSGQSFAFRVATQRDAGTVDYLREVALGREGGAYIRAIPRAGGGSVIVMTLPIVPGTEAMVVAATLRDELKALVTLVGSS